MSADRLALTVITGPLAEKMEAFKQIGSLAASGLLPSGYDSVPKVIAACWGADALGVHPFAFMQGVYAAPIRGKLQLIPKWEFEHALLKSRLPGYTFRVIEETETRCVLTGADGRDEHTVTYTIADANRQGLVVKARGQQAQGTYDLNPKEMLFKQAFHRMARRVGAHVLAGMPGLLDTEDDAPAPRPTQPASEAVVQDDPPPPAADSTPVGPDPHLALSDALDRYFGRLSRAKKLEKAGVVMSEIMGAKVTYPRADAISPHDARQIADFINAKIAASRPTASAPAPAPAPAPKPAPGPAPEWAVASGAAVLEDDDAPPPPNDFDAPPPPVEAPAVAPMQLYDRFMELCRLAQKITKREFIVEHPKGSGRWWMNDRELVQERPFQGALRIMKDGEILASDEDLAWLVARLETMTSTDEQLAEISRARGAGQ